MKFVDLIILQDCKGSEDGIRVKTFTASTAPQPVEERLAGVLIAQKWAKAPADRPAERQAKVIAVETKEPIVETKEPIVKQDTAVKKPQQ